MVFYLPAAVINPLEKLETLMQNRSCSFSLKSVHPDEVQKIISGLSNSSSFGLDLLDTYTIKLITPEILPAITHIVNLSITTKKFPQNWKKVKIIPLHKKEDPLNPKNYRPVAIVPILSKVLERLIFNQIVQYLTENKLLHPNHHAYRVHHNTTTALIQMCDVWLESVGEGELTGACLLDMSAAFDIVNHSLLIRKLELYGFESNIIEWFQSYLADRTQCVCIDGALSKLLPVNHGVPQGSILGPLLYTLFTNELPELIHDHSSAEPGPEPEYNMSCRTCGSTTCYADDTTFSCSDPDPVSLSEKLSAMYKVMSNFLVSNELKLNDDKTHLIVLATNQTRRIVDPDALVEIRTATETIKPSKCEKLLGGWIHQDLKWDENLRDNDESLMKTLNSRVGALKMISKVASFKNRKLIAEGIFMSKLSYLTVIYTPTEELLRQCGWLSVYQLSVYHSVLLVFKVVQTKSPQYLSSMFDTPYQYPTRQADSGMIKHLGAPGSELVRKSFRWRGSEDFNQLPSEIKKAKTLVEFKKATKKWILENVEL